MELTFIAQALLLIAATLLYTFFLYRITLNWLVKKGMIRMNYKGLKVPVGLGVIIPIAGLTGLPWGYFHEWFALFILQSIVLLSMAYVGWKDDLLGGPEAKGIKGHFTLWWREGVWTTGLSKAVIGCMLAAMVSATTYTSFIMFVMHFFIIVLFTNLINLLDLRPGRALKGFFALAVLLIALSPNLPFLLWIPICSVSAYLFIQDLRERIMLGDAGANCLGMALGLWAVYFAPLPLQIFLFICLVIVTSYTEKRSITALIQRVAVLNWLDQLGRKRLDPTQKPNT